MKVKKSVKKIRLKKHKNLEKKRGLFFEVGLILALSVVLLAFEWTTVRNHTIDLDQLGRGEIIEEMAAIIIHKKKPEMPKPKIILPIIVPDDTEIDGEEIDIDAEVKDNTENNTNIINYEIEEIVDEDPVPLYNVEKWPEFPGGKSAMMAFLSNNLKYTPEARGINLEGTVHVFFVIGKDGSIRDIEIKRGVGAGLDEEVERVISIMPQWTPGIQNGRNVSVIYNLPVKFKLN
jgi:protein TonB